VFAAIDKLSPGENDVLLFSIATDKNGDFYYDID
jgi:hypothetical protein